MNPRPPPAFFLRPALVVARDLLGQVLVRAHPGGRRAGRIVEVEAYLGPHDLAAHSSKGRTARTEVLFGRGGVAYVYLVYGMHHCVNVVTGAEGVAAAVLIRALEPLEGIAPGVRTDGPGKLCQALGITRADNRLDLRGDTLFLEPGPRVPASDLARGPRIGVAYAGAWADKPYRLWVRSKHPAPPSRPRPPGHA